MTTTLINSLLNAGGLGIFAYTVWVQLKAQVKILQDLSKSVILIAERQSALIVEQQELGRKQDKILEAA